MATRRSFSFSLSRSFIRRLDYALPSKRRRWWLLATVAAAAALVSVLTIWGPDLSRWLVESYRLQRGLGYLDPADTIIYQQKPGQPIVVHGPAFYHSQTGADGTIFLHGRRSGGQSLLVALCLQFDDSIRWPGRPVATLTLDGTVYYSTLRRPMMRSSGAPLREFLSLSREDSVTIFAAQPDPANDSRFTFAYEVNGVRGSMECLLGSDRKLSIEPLPGPPMPQRAPWPTTVRTRSPSTQARTKPAAAEAPQRPAGAAGSTTTAVP